MNNFVVCECSIVSMFYVFKLNIVNFIHGDVEIFVFNKLLVLFRLSRPCILNCAIIELQNYLVKIILIVKNFACVHNKYP